MSIIFELAGPASVASAATIGELVREWAQLRQTKKEDELKTPEWEALEKAYIEHLLWRFNYPKKVFGQQIVANWIITFVVGAITLVISLAFFALYLKYVFQIKHPVPPHVSLSETDAASTLAKLRGGSKVKETDEEDVRIVGIRNG